MNGEFIVSYFPVLQNITTKNKKEQKNKRYARCEWEKKTMKDQYQFGI